MRLAYRCALHPLNGSVALVECSMALVKCSMAPVGSLLVHGRRVLSTARRRMGEDGGESCEERGLRRGQR